MHKGKCTLTTTLVWIMLNQPLMAIDDLHITGINDNFTVPKNFFNVGDVYVYGDATINGDLFGSKSLYVGIDTDHNYAPVNLNTLDKIKGFANIHIYNNSIFSVQGGISGLSNSMIIDDGATVNLNTDLIGSGGYIYNRGEMHLGTNASLYIPLTYNYNEIRVTGTTQNISTWHNYGSIDVSNILSGTGVIYNKNTLKLTDNCENHNTIFNDALLTISGAIKNYAYIYNNKYMDMQGVIYANGTIVNQKGGLLNSYDSTIVANSIINQDGGIFNAKGSYAVIENSGVANINSTLLVQEKLVNYGIVNLANNINMVEGVFTNFGILNVIKHRTLDAYKVVSPGIIRINIYSEDNFDSLYATDSIDLRNGGVLQIESKFVARDNKLYSWKVLNSPEILVDYSTQVLTSPSLLKAWDMEHNQDSLIISHMRYKFTDNAIGELQTNVAIALDEICECADLDFYGDLINAVANSKNKLELAATLDTLLPDSVANAHNIATQNAMFNKVETRLTSLRSNSTFVPSGMAFGDLEPNSAVWFGSFGTLAHQKPYKSSLGYNAKAAGGMLGIDRFVDDNNILGIAFAVSNSNINESTTLRAKTRILGFHLTAYGSNSFASDSLFMEWLLSGITNKNTGDRTVIINGSNLSVNSSYRTAQGAVRINFGQTTQNDIWQFSLIEMLSYSLLYQPAYTEHSSPAALYVNPNRYSHYLTVGGGMRFAMAEQKKWLSGLKEIRILGTYDAINSDQAFTANFVGGVSDFTVTNHVGRWGFQAGATYTFLICDSFQLQFTYDFELRTKYTDNSGSVRVKYVF